MISDIIQLKNIINRVTGDAIKCQNHLYFKYVKIIISLTLHSQLRVHKYYEIA